MELAQHLSILYKVRKQDGVIFVGKDHSQLLRELVKIALAFFTSECPLFMPKDYVTDMTLRLDSNILFYHKYRSGEYQIADIFAVKGGEPIILELAKWDMVRGFRFQNNMNRWDRRVDFKGATFDNSLTNNGYKSVLLKNESDIIVGSTGWFQESRYTW